MRFILPTNTIVGNLKSKVKFMYPKIENILGFSLSWDANPAEWLPRYFLTKFNKIKKKYIYMYKLDLYCKNADKFSFTCSSSAVFIDKPVIADILFEMEATVESSTSLIQALLLTR